MKNVKNYNTGNYKQKNILEQYLVLITVSAFFFASNGAIRNKHVSKFV